MWKKIIELSVLSAFLVSLLSLPSSAFVFGVKGGVSLASFGHEGPALSGFSFNSRTRLNGGIYFSFELFKGLALQPEILYVQKGFHFKSTESEEAFDYSYDYLEIPVLLKHYFGASDAKISPYVFAGPYFGLNTLARYENTSDETKYGLGSSTEDFEYGISAGAGIMLKAGPGEIQIDGRYDAGLNKLAKKAGEPGYGRTRTWLITIGYSFSPGKNNKSQTFPQSVNTATRPTVKSEPVPGAEITIEQLEPVVIKSSGKTNAKTDEKGGFSVIIPADVFNKLGSEFKLLFTIKPLQPAKYPVETNQVKVTLKKEAGPKYDFIVTWEKLTVKANKGCFAVNPKAQQ
ncbi:MAG: porin family protein [Acidobacteriota bacterium]|nr:porin family protein [Acidobacteriota bacterium]